MSRQQFRLIEAALPPPAPVQWYWNQQVNRRVNLGLLLPQGGQKCGHANFAMVLPAVNQVGKVFAVQPGSNDTVEKGRVGQAVATD